MQEKLELELFFFFLGDLPDGESFPDFFLPSDEELPSTIEWSTPPPKILAESDPKKGEKIRKEENK